MKLHELKPTPGSQTPRKRVGRGAGSGTGKTAGRGHRGQGQRSGGNVRPGFEGGQTPYVKRLRKVGFTNPNRVEYAVVNVAALNRYDEGTVVTPEMLYADRLVRQKKLPIKILGNGSLEKKITVKAHKFTASAETKITDVGGNVEVI